MIGSDLDGIALPREQAMVLAGLVEDELRMLAASGGMSGGRDAFILDTKPTTLSEPPDLQALARVLAGRIAVEVQRAKVDDER